MVGSGARPSGTSGERGARTREVGMRNSALAVASASLVLGVATLCAAPAFAGEAGLESRLARVEQQLAQQGAPSARETQSAVDAYLASSTGDASLVGGCGSAGYDGGFWIRGGSFLLKINLTIQARYEWFDWDDDADEPRPGGDLSGWSLPRVTLKFSGDATCDIHYYAEFEFGHHGFAGKHKSGPVSYTHLRAHETPEHLVCR